MVAGCWLLQKLPHPQEFLPTAAHQLVRLVAAQILELADERFFHRLRRGFVIRVRSAGGFGNDLVDDAKLEQLLRGDAERGRRLLSHLLALAVLPENRGTALDGDD